MQFTLSHVVCKPGEYLVKFDCPPFVLYFGQILHCKKLEYRCELPSDRVRKERVILHEGHHLFGPIYQTINVQWSPI